MSITILAIESSCDDTSTAIIKNGEVLSNRVANQDVHRAYGGVVPELASRSHQANIVPVVEATLKDSDVQLEDLDAIAFTRGPGLLGSLIVGVSFAKALALSLDIPLVEVHHMHAHVLAHFAETPKPQFPFLCLTVSGGHTQIIKAESYTDLHILGTTIDDAAGEAFDKAGKMLGLPYPAGPHIDKLAQQGKAVFSFAEPRVPDLNFSFSGFKTSVLYFLRDKMKEDSNFISDNLNDLCASVQHVIISILMKKLKKAAEQTGIRNVAIAGGVSANSELREVFRETGEVLGWETFIPAFQYCTDNAGMVAVAGYFKYLKGEFVGQDVVPAARLKF